MKANTKTTFYRLLSIILLIAMLACKQNSNSQKEVSQKDKLEIEALQKSIPLILANQGWEPYEAIFSSDYQNWGMTSNKILTRDEFLGGVKTWCEAGNRAVGSDIETIGFIPISQDMVMYLHKQVETFDLKEQPDRVSRDIRFVSVFKKIKGTWKVHFTAFMDKPE